MRKVERVGVNELRAIKPRQTQSFILPTGSSRASAQSQAYRMSLLHPRDGVSRYACKSLPKTNEGYPLEITALPYDKD